MTLATVALKCAKQIGRANAAGTSITDLEAEIKEEIADTIKFYNRKKYHLTEVRGAILTTVADTDWYSTIDLTSSGADQDVALRTAVDTNTIVKIHYMRENPGASGLNEPLERVDYRTFERMYEGSVSGGTPTYYTFYSGSIGIWPIPDGAYTLYLSAHIKPPVPTADDDDSVWLTEAEEMIVAGALKRVCLKYLRDTQRAVEFAATEESARINLVAEYASKASSGRLRANA